jgi:hypothetical protein
MAIRRLHAHARGTTEEPGAAKLYRLLLPDAVLKGSWPARFSNCSLEQQFAFTYLMPAIGKMFYRYVAPFPAR